jgi:hypothetical protein
MGTFVVICFLGTLPFVELCFTNVTNRILELSPKLGVFQRLSCQQPNLEFHLYSESGRFQKDGQ